MVYHGDEKISCYKIDDLVYLTDCSYLDDKAIKILKNPKVLVIGALRYKPHKKHFNIDQAIEVSKKLNAQTTYFTHINHNIKHSELSEKLGANIKLAYDTLKLSF